jgi:hypothetical protein
MSEFDDMNDMIAARMAALRGPERCRRQNITKPVNELADRITRVLEDEIKGVDLRF